MIEFKNVSFQYEGSEQQIWNVNLSIAQGECVVLTGVSGCGKTTLTRLMNGLAPSYFKGSISGSICIDDREHYRDDSLGNRNNRRKCIPES